LVHRKKFHANGAHSHGVEVVSDVRGEASGGGKELRNNFARAVTRPDAALHVAGVFGPFGCPTPTREVINPQPLADDDALDSAEALQTVVARPVLTKYRAVMTSACCNATYSASHWRCRTGCDHHA
jgi:hypothetical protein